MRLKIGWPAKNPVHNVDVQTQFDAGASEPDRVARNFLSALDAGPLAIAVSGGSDSLGVLELLHRHNHEQRTLICLTVDHQLRASSADEARFVHAFCAERGILHQTLMWQGAKPKTGLQKKAREARYELLADACDAIGAIGLVTGHTLDDQFETIAMRRERKPTGTFISEMQPSQLGMSGMAPATLFDGRMWLLRPFLTVRRSQLRNMLGQNGLTWIDDPSNSDRRFERVRVRQSGDVGFNLDVIRTAQADRIELSNAAAKYIHHYCQFDHDLGARFEISQEYDDNVQVRALAAIIDVIGGRRRLISSRQMASLREFLAPSNSQINVGQSHSRINLGRALLTRKGKTISVNREERGFERVDLAPQSSVVWDGRFLIRNLDPVDDVSITYDETLGNGAPCFWKAGCAAPVSLENIETHQSIDVTRYVNRFDNVLLSFDLKLANSLSQAIRNKSFKTPPMPVSVQLGCG